MIGDTIYAVASGRPPAAIAVLRISGHDALAVAERLAGSLPAPGLAKLRTLRSASDGAVLDRALVLTFHAPASATGEDVVELHLHGGRAVIAAVEREIAENSDARLAEPGEFTRRAVLNGRIDLAQAEGLGDLLAAETEAQRRVAIANAGGAVSRQIMGWLEEVTALSATVEAVIDFGDGEEIDDDEVDLSAIRSGARDGADRIGAALALPPAEKLKDGIRVVLAGSPNSGKSSLFNAMCDRDAAIVTSIAGTTRDSLEMPISRRGIAYVIVDTAGLRDDPADPVERIGIRKSQQALACADIVVWMGDDDPPADLGRAAIAIVARCDLPGRGDSIPDRIAVSARSGTGIDLLWHKIERQAETLLPSQDQVALNRRQQDLCEYASQALDRASRATDFIMLAENLREARRRLSAILQVSEVETLLDEVFGKFCLGK